MIEYSYQIDPRPAELGGGWLFCQRCGNGSVFG